MGILVLFKGRIAEVLQVMSRVSLMKVWSTYEKDEQQADDVYFFAAVQHHFVPKPSSGFRPRLLVTPTHRIHNAVSNKSLLPAQMREKDSRICAGARVLCLSRFKINGVVISIPVGPCLRHRPNIICPHKMDPHNRGCWNMVTRRLTTCRWPRKCAKAL